MIPSFVCLLVFSLWPSALEMIFYLDRLCFSFNMKISQQKNSKLKPSIFQGLFACDKDSKTGINVIPSP